MLKTERLLIRRFMPADGPDLYEYLSDSKVVLYEPYGVFSREDCAVEVLRRALNEAFLAVCLLDGGKMIGNLYFHKQDFDTWELGYVFNSAYQGKGYAYESARALLDHAFLQLGARRVIAMCNPQNERSWRLMEKLRMRREGHLMQNIYFKKDQKGNPIWLDTYEYAVLASEWREMTASGK